MATMATLSKTAKTSERINTLYRVLEVALEHHQGSAEAMQADPFYAEQMRLVLEKAVTEALDLPTPKERLEMLRDAARKAKGFYDRYRDRLWTGHEAALTTKLVHTMLAAAVFI